MTEMNTGGAAFPRAWSGGYAEQDGMTLRDYFAGQALKGRLASEAPDFLESKDKQDTADVCYAYADAMLKARGEMT